MRPSHRITKSREFPVTESPSHPPSPTARQPSTGRATYPGTSSILKRLGVRCPSATTWLKICYSSERHGQKKCGACLRTRALCVTATHLLHSRRSSSSHHHCSLQLLADSDSRLLGSGSKTHFCGCNRAKGSNSLQLTIRVWSREVVARRSHVLGFGPPLAHSSRRDAILGNNGAGIGHNFDARWHGRIRLQEQETLDGTMVWLVWRPL